MKRQSAKAVVLAAYPAAYAYRWSGEYGWTIYATKPGDRNHQGMSLCVGASTSKAAWAAALANIKSKEKGK